MVLIASLGTFLLIWLAKPRRRSLVKLAAALPAGVLFQAVWGGIMVLTGLAWWTVAPHLLVSLLLLFVSIVILVRLRETDDPPVPVVPRPLRILTWATVGVLIALCVAGTLVTAAGPHGGDDATPRLDLPVRGAGPIARRPDVPLSRSADRHDRRLPRGQGAPRLLVRAGVLIAVTAAQGLIGLVQYATGVPEALVVAHVLGATLLTAAAANVVLATRTRGPGSSAAPAARRQSAEQVGITANCLDVPRSGDRHWTSAAEVEAACRTTTSPCTVPSAMRWPIWSGSRDPGVRADPGRTSRDCRVDAIADEPTIARLVDAGYRVDRHEDVDEAAQDSLKQVGKGNRYTQAAGE